jgi:hypothetical protein
LTSRTVRYAAACTALAIVGVLLCWPLLDGSGRKGALAAAALALPVQVCAFAGLTWGWSARSRFLAAWALGMLARAVAVGVALLLVVRTGLPPAPTLLALASFLFAMLLLEPLFLRGDPNRPVRT